MPYADPEERRAYHRAYMAEYRAKQPKPSPKPRKNACTLTEEELRARQLAHVKAYQARHPDRVQVSRKKANAKLKAKGYFEQWVKDNPDKVKAKQDRYRAKDPERAREKVRRHRAKNPDRVQKMNAASKRKSRAADPDGNREYQRAWKKKNPERAANYFANWYRVAKGKLSDGLFDLLMVEQGGKCPYCFGDLRILQRAIDHYMPIALGGEHVDANIQLTCRSCNSKKHKKHPAKFLLEVMT